MSLLQCCPTFADSYDSGIYDVKRLARAGKSNEAMATMDAILASAVRAKASAVQIIKLRIKQLEIALTVGLNDRAIEAANIITADVALVNRLNDQEPDIGEDISVVGEMLIGTAKKVDSLPLRKTTQTFVYTFDFFRPVEKWSTTNIVLRYYADHKMWNDVDSMAKDYGTREPGLLMYHTAWRWRAMKNLHKDNQIPALKSIIDRGVKPGTFTYYVATPVYFCEAGECEEALKLSLEGVRKFKPKPGTSENAELWAAVSHAYCCAGDGKKAEEAARHALLGSDKLTKSDYSGCLLVLEKAFRLQGRNAEADKLHGVRFKANGQMSFFDK